jgi:uncharacterized protein
MKNKFQKIKEIAEKKMEGLGPSHDFSHVMRVYNLALLIAKEEKNVDLEILKIAALLHDIGRKKEDLDKTGKVDHAILSAKMAEKILKNFGYQKEKIEEIKHCIATHRFKGNLKSKTIEAKILSDADKLDVSGAVGIVKSSCWIGENKAKIYSDISLKKYARENLIGGKFGGRVKDKSKHALNIEYEIKLKHILKRFFTKKAKLIAKGRIKFMKNFFERFKREIKGKL